MEGRKEEWKLGNRSGKVGKYWSGRLESGVEGRKAEWKVTKWSGR